MDAARRSQKESKISARTWRVVLASAMATLAFCPEAAAAPQVIATATSKTGNLTRTDFTVQVGPGPLDRFQMVRLVKDPTGSRNRGAVLFLPPLGSSFSFYEQADESGAASTSVAGFFAERGFGVYGYTPRYTGIPAGACEAGLLDCSVMDGWGLQSMLDDIAFIRGRIEDFHQGTPIVAGGASLGGILAVAAANSAPDDYDGVIVWEGMLASDDPAVQALNAGYCAALESQLAAGIYFDGVGPNVFRQVAQAAELEPGGANLNPLFPPTLSNHQVLVLSLAVPAPGPATMPVPGYVQTNGSFEEDRLFYASERRLFENVGQFNNYVPVRLIRDVSCALAGLDVQHLANLGSFSSPVLAIGGGRGFGAFMEHQLSLFGTGDVTFLLEPDFGHIDHFMTDRHREFVERPIFHWVERVFSRRSR